MRPSFLPTLVNGPLFDPVVYVRILNERKSVLFDCGHFERLAPRSLLSLEAVCISHTHMDHFMGMDRVLRTILHRGEPLAVYGPEGITERTLSKLKSYTWNLSSEYSLEIAIHEILDGTVLVTKARADAGFDVTFRGTEPRTGLRIADCTRYAVEAAVLDHTIPCLGYVLREPFHVNILKGAVRKSGYTPGPWLGELKERIYADRLEETVAVATEDGIREVKASSLCEELVAVAPGQSMAFVTDIACTPGNLQALYTLARGVDILFIEAYYLDELRSLAGARGHLTSRQAGEIAAMLGAKRAFPMHVSPRYHHRLNDVYAEVGVDQNGMRIDV